MIGSLRAAGISALLLLGGCATAAPAPKPATAPPAAATSAPAAEVSETLATVGSETITVADFAREMGRRAQERRRAEFDIEVMVRRLEDLYTELRARASR